MKFRLNDKVHKIGDWKNIYTIVAVCETEPRYRIQRGKQVATQTWIVSDDLETGLARTRPKGHRS